MIGTVFVYVSGRKPAFDQKSSDDFVKDAKCEDVATFLIDKPSNSNGRQTSVDFAEPMLRRLGLLEGVLVDIASLDEASHESLFSARAAHWANALTNLQEIGPAESPQPDVEAQGLQRQWMMDSIRVLLPQAQGWQGALEAKKGPIDKHARIVLSRALALGWQPLLGTAPEDWELDQEDEGLHNAVRIVANNLLQDHRALTLGSLYDAAAFVFSAKVEDAILQEVAQAMSDLVQIAAELQVPRKRDKEEAIEAVRTRTLARAIAPSWRHCSCIGSPGKHGVVILTETDADTARLVLRGVANARLDMDAATRQLARQEFANDEFEDLEVHSPTTGVTDRYQHYHTDSRAVLNALESAHKLDGPGFISIGLNAIKHSVIINTVSRFDVISFTREQAEAAATANHRFATYFA